MENRLGRKTSFDGRRAFMEDELLWKTNIDGGQTLMDDNFRWKTTLNGGRPVMEDDKKVLLSTNKCYWTKKNFGTKTFVVTNF